jgi:ribonuclease-3
VLVHLDEVLKTKSYKDAKSELQEIIQEKLKMTPTYAVRGESGPAHERRFTMGVYFGDKLIAEGEGLSKQDAEIEAAKNALKKYSK